MKGLFRYLRPYRRETVLAPLFKLLEAAFDLFVPLLVKEMIDRGIGEGDKTFLLSRFGLLILLALVGLSCAITAQFFAAKAAIGFGTDLRMDLFSHIGKLSFDETDRTGASTLITRLTSDVNQMQSGINLALRLLLRSPIIVLGAMVMAFTVNAKSALVFAVIIPLLSFAVFYLTIRTVPLFRSVQAKLDRVTSATRETLTGVRVLRAFRKEESEIQTFDAVNEDHNRCLNHAGRISSLLNPITLVLVNLGLILLLASGAKLVETGEMTQGEVVAMTNYMAQILVELVKFANTVFSVNKALASGSRIQTVFDLPVGMDQTEPNETGDDTVAVSFDRVHLTYSGNGGPSLSDISFSALRGQTVGIIGSTGSGKSSLVQLIPRFYDVSSGKVSVFGKDVRSYNEEDLRQLVSFVPQKAVLFSGTVRSNLLWGNGNATDGDLWDALEQAQAKTFIDEKEGGIDTVCLQGGNNFSGGQRQRLTIARALVRKAPILILDDSSSALDYATDAALQESLRSLPYRPTVFLISQRTASLCRADVILVLEDGRLVGTGTHESLLSDCPVYREIYESQFGKGGDTE